jgi:hypothetical protein
MREETGVGHRTTALGIRGVEPCAGEQSKFARRLTAYKPKTVQIGAQGVLPNRSHLQRTEARLALNGLENLPHALSRSEIFT